MNFEELKADYENKMAAKDDWFNGGYRTDVNSGQSYRDTLGFIGDVEQLQEDDGFIIKTAKSFANGITSGVSGTIGSLKMLRDKNIQQHLEQQPDYVINQEAVDILNNAYDTTSNWRYDVKKDSTAAQLFYGYVEGGGQMLTQIATRALFGAPASAILMGLQISGAQYEDLRNAGVKPEKAFDAALSNGIIQGVLEEVGIEKVLKAFPAYSGVNKTLREIAVRGMNEGFTELIQALPEQLSNIWAKQNNDGLSGYDTAINVAREWDENASDNIKDMVFQGIIGTLVGGTASGANFAIANGFNKLVVNQENKHIENLVDKAKEKGMNSQYTQAVVDRMDRGETAVNIDAQQVLSYAQTQQVGIDKVATSLGVTTSEIEDAAEAGLDITVSKGHMVQAMMEQNGFSEAIIPHVSYGEQGRSLNYYQMQEEMSKAYGEGSEVVKALDEELNAIEQSMLDAGVAKDQAKQARELYNAFAVSMSPENPAEWIKNHKVRFANEGKVSKKDSLFQVVYHGSPLKFNQFTLDHMGEGEGSQVHGYGLYFAKNKEVAQGYKERISNQQGSTQGTLYEAVIPEEVEMLNEQNSYDEQSPKVKEALQKIKEHIGRNGDADIDYMDEVYPKHIPYAVKNIKYQLAQAGYEYQLYDNINDDLVELGNAIFEGDQDSIDEISSTIKENLLEQLNYQIGEGWVDQTEEQANSLADKLIGETIKSLSAAAESAKRGEYLAFEGVNGRNIYNQLVDYTGDRKAASELLNKYGIKGIAYDGAKDGDCFVVFDDKAINILNAYNQSSEGAPKGSFTPQADGSYVISMFKNGDSSTVIHETGHYFFEIFMQESGLDTASDKLKKDRAAFLNYVGMTEEQWQAADFEGRRAAHERVATAFEQYLLEGKAPSKGLRGVFSRFSKWLKAIYGNVVNSNDYAELTDDVRQVFDHWLAADADIEQAARMQGFFGKLDSKLTANLSDKQKKWLEDKIYSAREKAIEILTKKYMENFRPERRAEIEAFRKANEEAVRERVHNYRVNEAKRSLIENFAQDIERPLKYSLLADFPIMRKIQVAGKPIQLSNRYLNWLNYDRGREEQYKSIQSEIDAALNPIIEKLNEGFGAKSRVAYIDTATGQEISVDEAQSRDKASPGYVTRFVSENDTWYQKWWKENHKQPTKSDLKKLAEDLYCGIDEYGVYGDLMTAHSVEQQNELDQYAKEQRAQLNEWYAERDKLLADDKYLGKSKRPKLSDDEAIFYEQLAEGLGYSSGSEMANDIINAKSESVMVRDELNALVKEKYPSYAEEKAKAELAIVESLNNDKEGEVIALEQQLIDEAAQTAFEREQTTQARMAKAAEAKAKAEVTARNTLLNMPMREALNIRRFAMAERRAAASAKKAIKAGDFEAASEFKRQQMVAHAMVRHSAKLKQEVERTKKFVKRLRKLKKDKEHFGNEQNFNQIAHLLYRLGIVRNDYNPNNRTQNLAEYLTEMTDKLGDGVPDIDESITNEMNDLRDSQNMTIEQYEKIRDALQNLYAIVKQDIQGTLDAKAKDFEENKENITKNLNKLDDKYTPSIGGVDNESFWKRQIAQRQSLDNFLEMMDGWTLGYFSKTFGAPLKHAADLQAKLTMEYEDAVSAAMKKWLPNAEARRAADTEQYYKELGGNANKHTLVNMLIHLGNQSSMERLCTSRVEGAENSKLWVFPDANNNLSREEAIAMTRENLINFLGKYLTAADVEFAQAKVDAANKLWPLLAQVNIDTKGFAPAKVEATPVAFKPSDGDYMTFRGGYYPLARDSRLGSQRQGAEAFSSTEEGSVSIKTMSTVQNTSKGRTNASYPVKLNYGYEMGIIQDTIHDIAYRQVMMNFNKIFSDKDIASLMKRKLGLENYNILKETLWKCARPRSLQDSVMAERSLTQAANWIRRKTVNAIIACNLKISLQNLGNVFLFGNTVEGFTQADVMAALPKIFSGLQSHKAMRQEVFAKSIFMRERAKAPDFAMKEVAEENAIIKASKRAKGVVNQVTEKLTWAEEASQTFGAKMLEVTDNITAVPVWLQAYNKKVQAGASEQEAIDFADTVIRRTLGSNRLQDVSSIQRGSSMYKLFTAFQSFFNTQFNQWYREANIDYKLYTKGEYKEAFMRVMSFALSKWIFACLANTIIGSLSFVKPFEKDEKKKWRDITQELITYPIAMTGGVGGQVALASTQALLGMQSYGYRLSIIENTLTKGVSLGTKINAVAQGKKDIDELAEPVAEITAIMLGLPLQFVRTPANLLNIAFDDMNFELEDIMNRRKKSERNRN